MTLIRYECEYHAHDGWVLVSVPNATKHATKGAITLPCDECGRAMRGRFV